MRRNRSIFLLLMLVFTIAFSSARGESLIESIALGMFQGGETYKSQHPDVKIEMASVHYGNTSELSGALLTGSLKDDLLGLGTMWVDSRAVLEKGYCLDLSSYPEIVNAVSRMYPRIREQCMVDGKVYGLPTFVGFTYDAVDEEAWAYTGSSLEEMPESFEELLDWTERWLDKAEAEDIRNVHLAISDSYGYDRHSYPLWLISNVLNIHILQQQYACNGLHFDDPVLRDMLLRCVTLGERLYQQEEIVGENAVSSIRHYTILQSFGGAVGVRNINSIVPCRLTRDQPNVLNTMLNIAVIPNTSQHQATAAEILCAIADLKPLYPNGSEVFVFADAPVAENPEYAANKARVDENISALKAAIAKAEKSGDSTDRLEKQLSMEEWYEKNYVSPYLVSPETVEAYRFLADGLFFPGPSVFNGTQEDMVAFDSLKEQYAAGSITVDELLSRLNEMARMIQAENQ